VFTGTRGRQLAGRRELICTGAFPYRDERAQLIAALEATLRLHRHEPGTLPALAARARLLRSGYLSRIRLIILPWTVRPAAWPGRQTRGPHAATAL